MAILKKIKTLTSNPPSLTDIPREIKKNLARSKRVVGMVDTMAGGYRAATRIGAWQAPPREILPRYIQTFCRKMANSFGVKVVEVEPVPQIHALWASNHISWMDIPVVGSVTPAFFLAKAEVATMPVFGRLATAAGALFINRGSGDASTVSDQMATFLKQGQSIVFFPEGTTSEGTQVHKLYGKLLQSAIDANMPVQPVVICYVNKEGQLDDQVPFCGGITMTQSLLRIIDNDPVTAYVLPLPALETDNKTQEALRVQLQQLMQAGLQDLHSRVLS